MRLRHAFVETDGESTITGATVYTTVGVWRCLALESVVTTREIIRKNGNWVPGGYPGNFGKWAAFRQEVRKGNGYAAPRIFRGAYL